MKNKESIDNLLNKAKNKFLLSNAISGRAKQISEGSLPYVDNFDPTNPIITAIREIGSDKIKIKLLATKKKAEELFSSPVKQVDEGPTAMEILAKGSKIKRERKSKKD
ncbi:MAG: DNA-directed RNA polymerase subunit omega [Candidatus Margulisiibacteriota bacterium]|nr:DNA-directed RNA polymerase subunit omega [Candidatus Margulisiibacteriota bacterium]